MFVLSRRGIKGRKEIWQFVKVQENGEKQHDKIELKTGNADLSPATTFKWLLTWEGLQDLACLMLNLRDGTI